MPAPDFHNYDRKVQVASRKADADATPAQRDAGVARVGTAHLHGLRVSIEYGKGAIRRGKGADGKQWSRVVRNPYGYIRGTEAHDGEQLDVWLGDHPASQLGYLVTFLTPDGEHDEYKAVLGVRNYAEAKKVVENNYPDDFWDTRVGEVRGFVVSDLKKHLKDKGIMKAKAVKAASGGFFCKGCSEFVHDRSEEDGCPKCDRKKVAGPLAVLVRLAHGRLQ